MRICSLIPGATEVVAALGLADHLVGISHECDFPPTVSRIPVMVEPLAGHDETSLSADIDRQVKAVVAAGDRLYRLNEQAFRDAQPDLILAQDLCQVCAVTPDQLIRAMQSLSRQPRLVTLSPTSLADLFSDIARIADVVGEKEKGQALVQALRQRLDAVRVSTATAHLRPRVVCLEWLDPLYLAGHWVPDMVALAGGQDVLGSTHAPSRQTTWLEVKEARPDIVLIMPCGYSINRTIRELQDVRLRQSEWRRALARWPNTYVVDAASYFSRPGPRLVDGVEILASIFHPDATNTPLPSEKALRYESAWQEDIRNDRD